MEESVFPLSPLAAAPSLFFTSGFLEHIVCVRLIYLLNTFRTLTLSDPCCCLSPAPLPSLEAATLNSDINSNFMDNSKGNFQCCHCDLWPDASPIYQFSLPLWLARLPQKLGHETRASMGSFALGFCFTTFPGLSEFLSCFSSGSNLGISALPID